MISLLSSLIENTVTMETDDNFGRTLREFDFLFKDGSFRFGVLPSEEDSFEVHIHDEHNGKCFYCRCFSYLFVSVNMQTILTASIIICNLCYTNSIGDEFHYLFQCNFFNNERKHFLPTINRSRNTSAFAFRLIMCETNETKLFKLCRFSKIVLNKVRSQPG